MSRRTLQNMAVLIAATGTAFAAVASQTRWLGGESREAMRERCYGVASAGANDCATSQHSCAAQAKRDHDPDEWVMLPRGLCDKLNHSRTEAL